MEYAMIVREIFAKTILAKSAIQDYALNAYVGCQYNSRSCYARFFGVLPFDENELPHEDPGTY